MMDLEDRLRGTFNDMADELPPSANPRGDLERRLATRRKGGWRTPALVAAAAAVVAAVAVPVMVFGGAGGSGTVPVGSGQPTGEPTAASETPADGRQPLGAHTENGITWSVYAIPGGAEMCSAPEGSEFRAESCASAQFNEAPGNHVVLSFALSEDPGPMASKLMFVTAPEVASLEVRDHAGAEISLVMLKGPESESSIFMADFGGPSDGFGYTAKDANGNVIEEVLT